MIPASIPDVCDVSIVRGAGAPQGAVPDIVLEMPHGATREAHFDAVAAQLRGPFPAALRDFFFVNTDVGSGELGLRVAARLAASSPACTVAVIRCLIPRTFVDCNRVIDDGAVPADAVTPTSGVTPGLATYVRDPRDRALLLARHADYSALVRAAFDAICGSGGRGLMLHTYAPRSIDVAVDDDIVASLHEAYRPGRIETWPLRAEVDLITRDGHGTLLADPALVAAVRAELEALGISPAENEAYHLHAATSAAALAAAHPGRTLCMEVRRDLLVREFTPFAEMDVVPEKVDAVAAALARALHAEGTAATNRLERN